MPRSRDLAAELPALAEILAVRLGPVTRAAFAMAAWDTAPRRAEVNGHSVRLEGYRSQDPHIVQVTGEDRRRIRRGRRVRTAWRLYSPELADHQSSATSARWE